MLFILMLFILIHLLMTKKKNPKTFKILSSLLKFLPVLQHPHSMAPDPFPVVFLGGISHFSNSFLFISIISIMLQLPACTF